jgi:hypothetical protein
MQGNQFGQAVQQQYSSFAENGTELLCMKKEYPMYASGGDMPSYENGGEYQTEWGGARSSFIILILKVLELHNG